MKKKVVSLLLTATMAATLFSGCGQPASQSTSSGGEVNSEEQKELIMYLLGDRATDFDLVYDEVNEILTDEINTTLKVNFLSWAEHDTKYSLLFSSGENFDLIFTASNWGHYETTAAKNGFYQLTEDFIQTYAPEIWEAVPSDAWNQAKVNGKIYMVPSNIKEYEEVVIGIRGDLMENYGMEDITSMDELEAYFDQVVAQEEGMTPLGTQGAALQWPYLLYQRGRNVVRGVPSILFTYEYVDPDNMEIEYLVDSPDFLEYARTMKEWYEKGYWTADAISSTDTSYDNWLQGKSAAMAWNLGSVVTYAREMEKTHPEWKPTFVVLSPDQPKAMSPYINNGMAINAASQNKERSMMVLNQLMTNKELQNITAYGIEGVHWKAVGDTEYDLISENNSRYPADGSCNWGWSNEEIKRTLYVAEDDYLSQKMNETRAQWDENTKETHILSTFSFNEEKVKSEVAVVNTVVSQYLTPISLGMVDDVDAAVAEFAQKLEEAGIQKIYEEVKKQTAEFVEINQ